MPKIVDARGQACPKPVLLTLEALKQNDKVVTIVDNQTAKFNVLKLAKSQGCEASVEENKDGISITIKRATDSQLQPEPNISCAAGSGTVFFIGSDILGRGENIELGRLLIQSFLNTIASLPQRPESILFMNNGVKLVTEGSHVLGELNKLSELGIELLACGTCLSRLGLSDKVVIGQVSNMFTLADIMMKADKVISL